MTAKEARHLSHEKFVEEVVNNVFFRVRNAAIGGDSCVVEDLSELSCEQLELALKKIERKGYALKKIWFSHSYVISW